MYQSPNYIVNLGKRFAAGRGTERDIEELESFCQSFAPAYRHVFEEAIQLGYSPTGRFPKSTASIGAKILRDHTRLTHMQDIAGIRIVVAKIVDQDLAVERLQAIDPCEILDRRVRPNHGYRAVHLIFRVEGVAVEAQVRTELQHQWAEVSEKLADDYPDIKYGGGPVLQRTLLKGASDSIRGMEVIEPYPKYATEYADIYKNLQTLLTSIGNIKKVEHLE
jgi:putative GTP pyrophosphokinase